MDFELRDLIGLARRWAWLFALSTAVAATGSWVATRFMPTTYASQSTLLVGKASEDPDPNGMAIYISQQLAMIYAQMATRQPILEGVVQRLGLPEDFDWRRLRGMVKVTPVPGQQLIEVKVLDTDPVRAAVIAGAVADEIKESGPTEEQRRKAEDQAFVQRRLDRLRANIDDATNEIDALGGQLETETSARGIAELQNRRKAASEQIDAWEMRYAQLRMSFEGSEINQIKIIEPATPGAPVGPNVRMNVLLAAAIGFGLALTAVLGLEYVDDTIKTAEDGERRLGLTGLATIEILPEVAHRADGLVTLNRPRSPIAEAFRVLRTNLQFALLDTPRPLLVVTSPNPGEGKSTTAANLAVVLAQAGKRVILVDADLRRPAVHRFFGLTNNIGLTSLVLDEELDRDAALRPAEGLPALRLLTSGPLPPNPAEMLQSERARAVIAGLRDVADIVVFDTPPVMVVADGTILAAHADATLLVLDSGTTRVDAAKRALATLAKVGVRPVGTVVNKLDRKRVGRYDYYYSERYAYQYGYDAYYGSTRGDGDGPTDGSGGPGDAGASEGPGGARRLGPGWPAWVGRLRQSLTSFLS